MPARALVVPAETIAQVVCDPNIVARGVGVAPKDIDDALGDPVHVSRKRTDQATRESCEYAGSKSRIGRICYEMRTTTRGNRDI